MDDLISRQAAIDALDCISGVEEVLRSLPSVQQEQKWIPCSDHPDSERNVFVARGDAEFLTACIGYYDAINNVWYEDKNWFAKPLYDALYWCEMPTLPKPYRGGSGT